MARIVVLGGGAAGSNVANRLRRRFAAEIAAGVSTITVVDQDDRHIFQPGLLFVPFGVYRAHDIVRPRRSQLHPHITMRQATVASLSLEARQVLLTDGEPLAYDVCIVASGAVPAPEETEGLLGEAWRTSIFDFYSIDGAVALAEMLATWRGGHLVVHVGDAPIKGPLAPLEFAFLADWYFTMRGMRGEVDLTFVTSQDGPCAATACRQTLGALLEDKGVRLVTGFRNARVDPSARLLIASDDTAVPFDLLVSVPQHLGARFVRNTPGLGDATGFVYTDARTLQSLRDPAVFAIGDATNLPVAKDATVAHFAGEVLNENVASVLQGVAPGASFDGHDSYFVETGFDKALLLDCTYDIEPHTGKFPLPTLGPLSLLEESHLNHLGKMAFKWIYWNVIVPGHEIPGLRAHAKAHGSSERARSSSV